MHVLINKISSTRVNVHLVKHWELDKTLTYLLPIECIRAFSDESSLIDYILKYYDLIYNKRTRKAYSRLLYVQVWDVPYYNHAKRTMLTYAMFKLLN